MFLWPSVSPYCPKAFNYNKERPIRKKNSWNKSESDWKRLRVVLLLKTLSLTVSKPETLVDFVGDSRLPFTQIIPIYCQRKCPQSLKSVPKRSLKKYKTKFRLNISFTLTLTLFSTGRKRNLFFQKKKKKTFLYMAQRIWAPQGKLFKILLASHVLATIYFSWRFTRKTKECLIYTMCDFPF